MSNNSTDYHHFEALAEYAPAVIDRQEAKQLDAVCTEFGIKDRNDMMSEQAYSIAKATIDEIMHAESQQELSEPELFAIKKQLQAFRRITPDTGGGEFGAISVLHDLMDRKQGCYIHTPLDNIPGAAVGLCSTDRPTIIDATATVVAQSRNGTAVVGSRTGVLSTNSDNLGNAADVHGLKA